MRVYEINGPMFFGMTDQIADISVKEFTKYLIIRMRGVPSLDSSGMNALENLYDYCHENGVSLIVSHATEQPMKTRRGAGARSRRASERRDRREIRYVRGAARRFEVDHRRQAGVVSFAVG